MLSRISFNNACIVYICYCKRVLIFVWQCREWRQKQINTKKYKGNNLLKSSWKISVLGFSRPLTSRPTLLPRCHCTEGIFIGLNSRLSAPWQGGSQRTLQVIKAKRQTRSVPKSCKPWSLNIYFEVGLPCHLSDAVLPLIEQTVDINRQSLLGSADGSVAKLIFN